MAISEAQRRATDKYNLENYARLDIRIPKDLSVKFKAKCETLGISQRAAVIELIENFIESE